MAPPEARCERPDCENAAAWDVLYHLRVEQEPRGARLCGEHLSELRQLDHRDMLRAFDVRELR